MTDDTLIMTAHAESGAAPHAQQIRIGHHLITADEPAANGGGDTGPSPTGLMLGALAACTSVTLRMYADRKGWALGTVRVDVRLLRSSGAERIERSLRFGAELTAEQVGRLLEIAEKTPVTRMLKAGVPIATQIH
jgi:putative redox protein